MDFSQLSEMTEDQAREHLERIRWPKGACCPRCGSVNVYRMTGKATRAGVWRCRDCPGRAQFTVTVGTIFEASHIPVRKWLLAVHLMCASKKGISALALKRHLGLKSYKSAWHMAHRIRYAMSEGPLAAMLGGTVEIDECYIGGKPRTRRPTKGVRRKAILKNPRGRGALSKTPVVAFVERGGPARARVIPAVTAENLRQHLQSHVEPGTMLMTDDFKSYRRICREHGTHQYVRHSYGEYVSALDPNVHSNTVESFFALLKRGVYGTFHHVSPKHLQRYCDEFAFRWSNRKTEDDERAAIALKMADGKRLTYSALRDGTAS